MCALQFAPARPAAIDYKQRVEINAIIDEFCNLNHKHYILFTFCCVAIPAALVALRIIGLPIFLTAESCYKSLEALKK